MGRLLLILAFLMVGHGIAMAQKAKKTDKVSQTRQGEELFMDGMRADMLGNTEKAIYFYEKALEVAPQSPGIHYKLAEMQARQGRYKDAQYYAEKALDLDPDNLFYLRLLAALYSQNNEHEPAIKMLQRGLKAHPQEADLYQLLTGEYVQTGKNNDALKVLERAEAELGPAPELARERQQIYLKQDRLNDALKEARKLVAANPDEPEYLLNLAELLISNNKVSEAGKLLDENRSQLDGLAGYAILQLQVATKNGDTKAAKAYLLSALSNSEMDLDDKLTYLSPYLKGREDSAQVEEMLNALQSAHRDQAKVYFLRGDYEGGRSRFPEARSAYLRGLALDKNNYTIWEQVARLDMELHQPDSLASHTDKALDLFPNASVLWFYNGWGHFMQKENSKAIRSFERARKLKPANPIMEKEVYAMLGDLYNTQKEYSKSDDAYAQALKLDSLDTHVLNNYSYYLSVREEKLDLAASLGAKLMSLAPDESTYQDTYGWVLFKKGDYAQALKYLEKACRPDASGVIWEHLGDALYKNGQPQKAVEVWKQAQRRGGELSPKLQEKINQGRYVE